jgi:transglutaminase-like putative cysteine protease
MAGLFPWLLPLLIYSIDQEIVSDIKYFPRAEKYINCRRLFGSSKTKQQYSCEGVVKMKKRLFPAVLAGLFLLVLLLLPALSARAAGRAAGTIVMEFDLSAHEPGKEARLWIPYPLSDEHQLVTDISVTGDYSEAAVYSDRTYATPMLYARWPEGARSRKLTFRFRVLRDEVVKKDFPAREGAWNRADFAAWLRPSSRGPIDGEVKKLADRITAGKSTVYEKARAIYDWVCENMYRDPKTRGCGPGEVCALLKKPGGKCTDIHSVFVALCRAAGVPAREIFGIRLGKKAVVDITRWQHCWAEFYLPGYGWVPVDPADVRKLMLKRNLKLGDPGTAKLRRYFWGAWDPYRVRLAVGRDLTLNPPQQGPALNTFGYPYAEIGGRPLDWLDPASFKYRFTCRQ